jgi:hypothetical protein
MSTVEEHASKYLKGLQLTDEEVALVLEREKEKNRNFRGRWSDLMGSYSDAIRNFLEVDLTCAANDVITDEDSGKK